MSNVIAVGLSKNHGEKLIKPQLNNLTCQEKFCHKQARINDDAKMSLYQCKLKEKESIKHQSSIKFIKCINMFSCNLVHCDNKKGI